MTTIAWDGQIVAADSLITEEGTKTRSRSKVKRLRNGALLAICGDYTGGLDLMEWYADGADREDWPAAQQQDIDTCGELLVFHEGKVWHYQTSPTPCLVEEPYFAWGTGARYAVGIMDAMVDLGFLPDAQRAVRLTLERDVLSGGRIRSFRI